MVFGVCGLTFLTLRFYLSWQNKKRERESHDDSYDDVYLTHVDEKGNTVQKKVDRVRSLSSSVLAFTYIRLVRLFLI